MWVLQKATTVGKKIPMSQRANQWQQQHEQLPIAHMLTPLPRPHCLLLLPTLPLSLSLSSVLAFPHSTPCWLCASCNKSASVVINIDFEIVCMCALPISTTPSPILIPPPHHLSQLALVRFVAYISCRNENRFPITFLPFTFCNCFGFAFCTSCYCSCASCLRICVCAPLKSNLQLLRLSLLLCCWQMFLVRTRRAGHTRTHRVALSGYPFPLDLTV